MHRFKYLIIALMIVLLNGCTNQSNNMTNGSDKLLQSIQPSKEIESHLEDLESPSEQFMMDMRETINLSFKLFQAMDQNDYAFLESSKATGVKIDNVNNRIIYKYEDNDIEYDFLKGININNLEYWGSGYAGSYSKFHIVFARYLDDTYGTIYFDFVKEENKWLFSGLSTNA